MLFFVYLYVYVSWKVSLSKHMLLGASCRLCSLIGDFFSYILVEVQKWSTSMFWFSSKIKVSKNIIISGKKVTTTCILKFTPPLLYVPHIKLLLFCSSSFQLSALASSSSSLFRLFHRFNSIHYQQIIWATIHLLYKVK